MDGVVSHVFTELFERGAWEAFEDRGKGSLLAFLNKALDATMIDILRHHSAEKRGGKDVVLAINQSGSRSSARVQAESPEAGPSTLAAAEEIRDVCAQALSGDQKTAWLMRVIQGLGFAQIGVSLAAR